MSGSIYSSSQFAAYAAAIRQRESSDDYSKVNKSKHLGAYQFSSEGRNTGLQAAGFQDANGNWTALAKRLGVDSVASFLSTPTAQDIAFQNYTERNFYYLRNFQSYIGKTIGGIHITESGMLAGAHLVGQGYVKRFLISNGKIIKHDQNGTPITEYMIKFSHFNFTFPANSSGFSPAINIQPVLAPKHQMAPRKHLDTILKFAIEGKTPTDLLHHTKAQAQLASKKRAPTHMMLHNVPINPRSSLLSVLNAAQKRTPAHMMLHNIPINPRSQLLSVLNAAKNPVSDHVHLHTILSKSRLQHRCFAPVRSRIARSAPPARTTHHAPAPRPSNSASFTPKIYHDPEGNLPPSLAEYFYRLSRLPPNGGTAFDPYLTPTWAGLKLPG